VVAARGFDSIGEPEAVKELRGDAETRRAAGLGDAEDLGGAVGPAFVGRDAVARRDGDLDVEAVAWLELALVELEIEPAGRDVLGQGADDVRPAFSLAAKLDG